MIDRHRGSDHTFVKTHRVVHSKLRHFTVSKFYLKKITNIYWILMSDMYAEAYGLSNCL